MIIAFIIALCLQPFLNYTIFMMREQRKPNLSLILIERVTVNDISLVFIENYPPSTAVLLPRLIVM